MSAAPSCPKCHQPLDGCSASDACPYCGAFLTEGVTQSNGTQTSDREALVSWLRWDSLGFRVALRLPDE